MFANRFTTCVVSGGPGHGMAGDLRRLEIVSGRVEDQYQTVDGRVQPDVARLGQIRLFGKGIETYRENVEGCSALPETGDDPGVRGVVGIESLVPRGPIKVHGEADPVDLRALDGSAADASRLAEEPSFVVPNFEVSAKELDESFVGQTHVFLPFLPQLCGRLILMDIRKLST